MKIKGGMKCKPCKKCGSKSYTVIQCKLKNPMAEILLDWLCPKCVANFLPSLKTEDQPCAQDGG